MALSTCDITQNLAFIKFWKSFQKTLTLCVNNPFLPLFENPAQAPECDNFEEGQYIKLHAIG